MLSGSLNSVYAGGELVPIDTTALLVAATYSTAPWLIPLLVALIGFGIIITQQKKSNIYSCPSCKLETDDSFELGNNIVGKCNNFECRVDLFLIEKKEKESDFS